MEYYAALWEKETCHMHNMYEKREDIMLNKSIAKKSTVWFPLTQGI